MRPTPDYELAAKLALETPRDERMRKFVADYLDMHRELQMSEWVNNHLREQIQRLEAEIKLLK